MSVVDKISPEQFAAFEDDVSRSKVAEHLGELTNEDRLRLARHHFDLHVFVQFSQGEDYVVCNPHASLEFLADLASILWGDGTVK